MHDARAGILRAVAAPKQFLWAPFELAIINMIAAIAVMLVLAAILRANPILGLVPLFAGHVALVVLGARDPHLTTQLQCMVQYPGRRKNLSPVKKGVKYVP